MEKNQIKAVLFDIGGVLALGNKNKSVHEFMHKKLNVFLDQWFDSIDTLYVKAFEGKLTKEQTLNIMARNLKTNPKKLEKLWIQAYKRCFSQNVELYNFAFKLKKQGYKIAILSDQWPVSRESVMPRQYINKFDVVISSDEVGIRKPNPEIYQITLKRLKVKPSEALFIDNQIWNIKPAEKLGIYSILYQNNKQLFRQMSKMER